MLRRYTALYHHLLSNIDSHWIHDSDFCPFSSRPVNLVSHDGSAEMVSMNSEGKWRERQDTILHLATSVPKFFEN
jgi:hypothetical protein